MFKNNWILKICIKFSLQWSKLVNFATIQSLHTTKVFLLIGKVKNSAKLKLDKWILAVCINKPISNFCVMDNKLTHSYDFQRWDALEHIVIELLHPWSNFLVKRFVGTQSWDVLMLWALSKMSKQQINATGIALSRRTTFDIDLCRRAWCRSK